jgi:hypothetical protein
MVIEIILTPVVVIYRGAVALLLGNGFIVASCRRKRRLYDGVAHDVWMDCFLCEYPWTSHASSRVLNRNRAIEGCSQPPMSMRPPAKPRRPRYVSRHARLPVSRHWIIPPRTGCPLAGKLVVMVRTVRSNNPEYCSKCSGEATGERSFVWIFMEHFNRKTYVVTKAQHMDRALSTASGIIRKNLSKKSEPAGCVHHKKG